MSDIGAFEMPHALPVFGAERNRRSSHGLGEPSPSDEQHRPVYVVWELTQACDYACGQCGSPRGVPFDRGSFVLTLEDIQETEPRE